MPRDRRAYYVANAERIKAQVRAYALAHPEKVKGYKQKWEATHKDAIRAVKAGKYQANREAISARQRAKYEADPSDAKARAKAYRAANPEKAKAAVKAWCQANPARLEEMKAEWLRSDRRLHPEKYCERASRHRALKRSLSVGTVNYKQILETANGLCGICQKQFDLFGIDFDHIIPLAKGGPHTTANIQATHARCNRSKGARLG